MVLCDSFKTKRQYCSYICIGFRLPVVLPLIDATKSDCIDKKSPWVLPDSADWPDTVPYTINVISNRNLHDMDSESLDQQNLQRDNLQ